MNFGLFNRTTVSEVDVTVEEEVLYRAWNNPLVSIVLPTFNESKNISELLYLIEETMQKAKYEYECIFVDDSSDNTPQVILEHAYKYVDKITLIKRSGKFAKTGLTAAFRRGFAEARGEVIVCMDTDLQHPPAQITNLVNTLLTRKVDVTVASRYAYGGSAEGLDGIFRKIVSRSSNYFVWLLLPSTRNTTDPMTGFFAFKKETLSKVNFSSLGFKILVELLSGIDNPKVIDIPFTFLKRKEEVSKAKLIQGFIFYRDVLRLFFYGPRGSESVRYVLLATLTSLTYLILLSLSSLLGLFVNIDSFFWHKENILIICVALSSVPIFGWAFHSNNYSIIRSQNILSVMAFITLVSGTYLHIFGGYDLSLNRFLAIPATLFASYTGIYLLFRPLWKKDYQKATSPERWFFVFFAFIFFTMFSYFLDFTVWWYSLLLAMYTIVIAQGIFALYLMIYTWENGTDKKVTKSKTDFPAPYFSFTAIVPCKHEKNTIADTLQAMNAINYPAEKKQIIVVIHEGTDDGTIGVVLATIEKLQVSNIQLVTYNEAPVNKPHGLNVALEKSTGDYVAIFDAEDEPHRELFNVVNASLISTNADVLQSGVQLMNFASNWYSTFNVLEYYFWFKSSLHFYAKNNVMPLGGVSVFFRKTMLQKVNGWDLNCLTEDAEIGIRLSQAGAKMSVIYDAEYATREETPPTVAGFVKQRTRWAQGFLQILSRRAFVHFPTFKQRFLAAYILSWPLIIPFVFLLFPFGIILMVSVSIPPALAVLSNISLLLFIAFIITLIIGFYEFAREYQLKFSYSRILVLVFLFYPYTLLLTIASLRAMYRNIANINVWEKTEHINIHRQSAALVLEQTPITVNVAE